MSNRPYLNQMEVDGVSYDFKATNAVPAIQGYGGNDLSEEFANAAALHTAIAAGDFSKIHIGDYWPITISGSYKDFSEFTVPSGTAYFAEATLSTSSGTTDAAMSGVYQSATAVKITISGTDYYVAIGDCTPGYSKSINAVMKMEVAAINPYIRHGDTELTAQHILMCSRDCMPNTMRMRAANSVWYDTAAVNPWLGSALYATLNDADNGIISLVDATALGTYVFKGPNNKGMRAMLPSMAAGASSPTGWAWSDRGRLFLPTEREVYGAPAWGNAGGQEAGNLYNQWPIFAGSSRHIMKGAGDGGGRTHWWLETAALATSFANVSNYGTATSYTASDTYIRVPLCFLLT